MVKSLEKDDPKLHESSSNPAVQESEPSSAQAVQSSVGPSSPPTRRSQPQVKLDESKAVASYANFCRVTGTPEELIIDYGLNSQPFGQLSEPIPATLRVIMNYYTAKRMLAALQLSVQRHEAAFGVLETDVQRRVRPEVLRQPAPVRD